jgi:hypothetical protein
MPELVAHDRDARSAHTRRAIFLGKKVAAERRNDAKCREIVSVHVVAVLADGFVVHEDGELRPRPE